jgi:hypothetical protein
MDRAIHRSHEENRRTLRFVLTPTQYKAALKALGLSQHLAGDWLGIGRRTSQGYALGEYPVPEPVAKLLRLCVKLKLNPEDVK